MINQTLDLFSEYVIETPETEGIKYAGSKLKLLPYIYQLIKKVNPSSVLDGFSGTTRVSQSLAQSGYRVVANDLSIWSEVFAKCYLLNAKNAEYYAKIVKHLNSLPGVDGWFTQHYGGEPNSGSSIGEDGLKKPWQKHNTRKLDAIREEVDRLGFDDVEKSVLIASLILALDQVDSTMGHYASYLNEWSPRSYNTMCLQVPHLFHSSQPHLVYRGDIFNLLDNVETDLAYFDPPYGSNNEKMPPSRVRYSAYYHLWTTVCLNDRPELFGKAKRRKDTSDSISNSVFEEFRRDPDGRFIAVKSMEQLLRKAKAKFIILSYSSGGRATAQELKDAISSSGEIVEIMEIDYRKNVMASMKWTNEWIRDTEEPNREFLFLIRK